MMYAGKEEQNHIHLMSDSLKGKTIGKLTVLRKAKTHTTMRFWECQCECGNEIVVSQDDLFWHSVTSCGCDKAGKDLLDLTGQVFGRLTVLRETDPIKKADGSPMRRWLCRCECGREVVIRQGNLTSRITRSCGCLKKIMREQRKTAKAP